MSDPRPGAGVDVTGGREGLEAYLHREVPISAAMGLRVVRLDPHELVLAAPLAGNTTDKGTAFSGVMLSLLALSGYSVTLLAVAPTGADVVIGHAEADFRAPLEGDIEAACPRPDAQRAAALCEELRARGRARWELSPRIVARDGTTCVRFTGTYHAYLRGR